MKIKEILHHIFFGITISGFFGIIGFIILLFPIFTPYISILEIYMRIIGFCIFEIGLFISGIRFSVNYEKDNSNSNK